MDYGAIIQAAIAAAAAAKGQQLTQEEIDLLRQQVARVQGVPLAQIPQVTPDQLGPSAEAQLSPDEGMRSKQLAAISELQNTIDQGGLNYEDKAQLNEATQSAANQQHRALSGVAGDAAARGQLNSGNRMMMDLSAAQSGANAARSTGLEVAAQAQQRRLAAIAEAAGMESSMRNQDFSEKDTAARAKDIRDQRNQDAREKAQYYNAGIPQQNFNNAMAKATGTGTPTNSLVSGLETAGNNMRGDAATASNAVGAATSPPSTSATYTYDPRVQDDLSGNRGGYQDLTDPNDK